MKPVEGSVSNASERKYIAKTLGRMEKIDKIPEDKRAEEFYNKLDSGYFDAEYGDDPKRKKSYFSGLLDKPVLSGKTLPGRKVGRSDLVENSSELSDLQKKVIEQEDERLFNRR